MPVRHKTRWRNAEDLSSREWRMKRRESTLRCALCPPHRAENASSSRRSPRKPRKRWK